MIAQSQLDDAARNLADGLRRRNARIVFAESCTGGLVSATLTRLPGISEWLCGSAVVYQLATKREWLGISQSLLDNPGPVSREVAAAMAAGVLTKTPHAMLAASVTGHLGPNAPPEQDGLVYIAVARRVDGRDDFDLRVEVLRLPDADGETSAAELRIDRQREVAARVLRLAAASFDGP